MSLHLGGYESSVSTAPLCCYGPEPPEPLARFRMSRVLKNYRKLCVHFVISAQSILLTARESRLRGRLRFLLEGGGD